MNEIAINKYLDWVIGGIEPYCIALTLPEIIESVRKENKEEDYIFLKVYETSTGITANNILFSALLGGKENEKSSM